MEADISQLEAPTFTTISRGPPEPMLRLKWDHKVNLIGEKVLNPMIHCCDQCVKPILIYGRMIPCKHVFCLRCARSEPVKACPRCKEKVVRVEQSGLGTVFMCIHGGSRYNNSGCRRTYLSQRDLQAHINHRHVAVSADPKVAEKQAQPVVQRKTAVVGEPSPSRQSAVRPNQPFTTGHGSTNQTSPVTTGRGSLIPIPIQELQQQPIQPLSSGSTNTMHHHQPQQSVQNDLSAYFSQQQQQQYGHGQVPTYGSVLPTPQSGQQQTQQFGVMGLQQGQMHAGTGAQQSNVHNIPPPVSTSSQFYTPYGQYNPMQAGQHNQNYSGNRSNYEMNQPMQQQQSQWQQQYYR